MLPAWLSAWHLAARKGQKLRTFSVYFHMISFPVCGLCSVTAASSSPWVSRARTTTAVQKPSWVQSGEKTKNLTACAGTSLESKGNHSCTSSSRSWFSVSLPGDPSAPGGCSSLVQAPNHPSSHLTLFISNPGFPKAPRHSVLSIMMWEVPGEAPTLLFLLFALFWMFPLFTFSLRRSLALTEGALHSSALSSQSAFHTWNMA